MFEKFAVTPNLHARVATSPVHLELAGKLDQILRFTCFSPVLLPIYTFVSPTFIFQWPTAWP